MRVYFKCELHPLLCNLLLNKNTKSGLSFLYIFQLRLGETGSGGLP